MEDSVENKNSRTRKWKVFFLALGFSLLGLPVLFVVRSLLFQPFNIPSASSEPNLMVGDYVFVSKFAYGYSKYSFSPFNFFSFEGRTGSRLPQRGDLTVFKDPRDVRIDYIKRVVGLPGDHIQLINGVLNINGSPVQLESIELPPEYYDQAGVKFYRETLPGGRSYVVGDFGETAQDNTEEYVVPAKHYFMLGDSRDNSQDSRFLDKIGYVPEENLVGRVAMIWQNVNGFSILNRPEEIHPKP